VPKTYSYDPAGNVISDGVYTFGYDARGRLVDVDSGAASYQFNGMGQRIRKDAADTALFHYDESGRLIGEYDVLGAPLRETVWFNGEPVAVMRNGDTFFVHTDHLGTPRAITSGGTVVWRWESDPFGTTQAQEDPDGDGTRFAYNLRFPGQFYDTESGLHYNYLRTYDPATGRFLESDPIGLAGGSNTFAYVGGNPLTYFDLFGLDIYRFPGNVYTDRPATTASGSGCETPIWSGGYIVGWTECEKEIEDEVCPASSTPPPPPPRRAETGEDSPGDAEPATDIADDAISTAQDDYQVCLANALNDGLAAAGATIPPTVAALILLRRFGFSRRTTAIVGGELAAADAAFATAYGVGSVQKCRTERERAYGL